MPRSLEFLQNLWNNTVGDEIDKTIALFREYTQLGADNNTCHAGCYRFFKGYWRNHYAAEIAEVIIDFEAIPKTGPAGISIKPGIFIDVAEDSGNAEPEEGTFEDYTWLSFLLKKIYKVILAKHDGQNLINPDGDVANILRTIQHNTELSCYNEIVLGIKGLDLGIELSSIKTPIISRHRSS